MIRVTYPGSWEDFNTPKQALKFIEKKLKEPHINLTIREFKKENILTENRNQWK
jgi:hypothetical protein